jgi:hypothetical protein
VTRVDFNQMLREAAGRRDPELAQQPVERVGMAGVGVGGGASGRPKHRGPHEEINEQIRNALAVKRGLMSYGDLTN